MFAKQAAAERGGHDPRNGVAMPRIEHGDDDDDQQHANAVAEQFAQPAKLLDEAGRGRFAPRRRAGHRRPAPPRRGRRSPPRRTTGLRSSANEAAGFPRPQVNAWESWQRAFRNGRVPVRSPRSNDRRRPCHPPRVAKDTNRLTKSEHQFPRAPAWGDFSAWFSTSLSAGVWRDRTMKFGSERRGVKLPL